ncbi:MAG: VOC family protein [bacterium]
MQQRVSLITLGVRDLKKSQAFYEALGWTAHPSSQEGVIFFQLPGMVLALYGRTELAEDAQLPPYGTGFGGIALAYNAASKDDVDIALAQAVKAGATLLRQAHDAFWGGYSGYFADPDGHPWEVAWNPFWTLGDDGTINLGG